MKTYTYTKYEIYTYTVDTVYFYNIVLTDAAWMKVVVKLGDFSRKTWD
jgi:hypothetical protein